MFMSLPLDGMSTGEKGGVTTGKMGCDPEPGYSPSRTSLHEPTRFPVHHHIPHGAESFRSGPKSRTEVTEGSVSVLSEMNGRVPEKSSAPSFPVARREGPHCKTSPRHPDEKELDGLCGRKQCKRTSDTTSPFRDSSLTRSSKPKKRSETV